MQKMKVMQEFTFAINVEVLHRNLLAKLPMHNCARAKYAKSSKSSIQRILQVQSSGHDARIQQ